MTDLGGGWSWKRKGEMLLTVIGRGNKIGKTNPEKITEIGVKRMRGLN